MQTYFKTFIRINSVLGVPTHEVQCVGTPMHVCVIPVFCLLHFPCYFVGLLCVAGYEINNLPIVTSSQCLLIWLNYTNLSHVASASG